ncbi:MAG: sialate O-acetylesterase [Phycisphaerae bacterium]
MRHKQCILSLSILLTIALCAGIASAGTLKTHGVFSSEMVIQRDKPIKIWGWAKPGGKVSVQFGRERAAAAADGKAGRWEVTFPPRGADANSQRLTVTAGDEKIEMDNIVIGDVWVMNGQSNMAFGLGKTFRSDLETSTAHLPLLREVRIAPNEHYTLQEDLPAEKVSGWNVSTPETAGAFSAIGYAFGSRLARALQIPVGIIDNARGGASIESLVPRQKFKDHPLAARYLAWVEERRAEFDWDAAVQKLVERWEKTVAQQREKGVPEDKLPPKPTRKDLRSWNIPGKSPSDAASCYNGMFGVFKGLNIKGAVFHQGYNNAMGGSCRPKRYRVLMKLMVEGWREDFNDPNLPVGVIEFCAGSITQSEDNFEIWSNHRTGGAFIREAQRLGLADLKDPTNTGFIPGYDQQIPGLHPAKKHFHGVRAARWALKNVYGMRVGWDTAELLSAKRDGDRMVLTFDKPVMPDDMSMVPEGFAIADKSGKFYMAHAAYPIKKDVGIWNSTKACDTRTIYLWSPLVEEPVAVRYAWAGSPMGNLKVDGRPWQPLHSFRTDTWDLPEPDDPSLPAMERGQSRQMELDSIKYCQHRKMEEARRAVEILERLKTLGRKDPKDG